MTQTKKSISKKNNQKQPNNNVADNNHNISHKWCYMWLILIATIILCISIGFYFSIDVQGWTELYLFLMIILISVYQGIFFLIDKISPSSIPFSTRYTSILSITFIIYTYLFYSINIDWIAINNGEKKLTFFQSVIRNDFATYYIFGSFLVIYLGIALYKKYKTN